MQSLRGVVGHFSNASRVDSENHAIALVLGRLLFWFLVHNIPDYLFPLLVAQLVLAGVSVGHLHHSPKIVRIWSAAAVDVIGGMVREEFSAHPCNLPCPSMFRLIWDGVTLPTGVTCLVVVVVFTTATGEIVTRLLDAARMGRGATGELTLEKLLGVLGRFLPLDVAVPGSSFCSSPALPISSGRRALAVCRGSFLTSLPLDRAYCGRTGNQADRWLCESLGTPRCGMADAIHCFNSAGYGAWFLRGGQKEAREDDASLEKGDTISASSSSAESTASSRHAILFRVLSTHVLAGPD